MKSKERRKEKKKRNRIRAEISETEHRKSIDNNQ